MSSTNNTNEHAPILMTEEYWANSQFSLVRYQGQMRIRGVEYIIVNKEGKDIFECSWEAHLAGRQKAIEPGEPCDLIERPGIGIKVTGIKTRGCSPIHSNS